jgi:Domain of unknown function (DUF4440)
MTNMTHVGDDQVITREPDGSDEIIALERRLWTGADDPATFREILADGAITMIEPMGAVEKQQAIDMTADEPWTDVEMRDVIVRSITPDLVILAYHGSATQAKDGTPYRGSIASTYARIDGQWQLAMSAHQPWEPKA